MLHLEQDRAFLEGPAGRLEIPPADEIVRKLAMLFEGQCEGLGPSRAARKYDLSRQRYFQLLHAFRQGGALASSVRGVQRVLSEYGLQKKTLRGGPGKDAAR